MSQTSYFVNLAFLLESLALNKNDNIKPFLHAFVEVADTETGLIEKVIVKL